MATTKKTGTADTEQGFTDDERAAMKERAKEVKAGRKRATKADPEADVLAKIAEMDDADRVLAERIHVLVKENAPDLAPKTWYGMPAYARAGKVVCFFQSAQKFKSRYATLGFSDEARLDEGAMWASAFALTELTPEVEARVADLVKRAAG
ncbi:iron chaperone [Streptomyces sp. NPDC050145]|uniref:iron chaperone n=1 Tax=Streptomyces sp. NPDC050145 TaxID=3365602 RepID=UPI0037BAAECD